MARIRFIRFLSGLALVLCLAGCTSGDSPTEQLRVEDVVYREMPGGARIVTGTVFNDGDAEVTGAQLQL